MRVCMGRASCKKPLAAPDRAQVVVLRERCASHCLCIWTIQINSAKCSSLRAPQPEFGWVQLEASCRTREAAGFSYLYLRLIVLALWGSGTAALRKACLTHAYRPAYRSAAVADPHNASKIRCSIAIFTGLSVASSKFQQVAPGGARGFRNLNSAKAHLLSVKIM